MQRWRCLAGATQGTCYFRTVIILLCAEHVHSIFVLSFFLSTSQGHFHETQRLSPRHTEKDYPGHHVGVRLNATTPLECFLGPVHAVKLHPQQALLLRAGNSSFDDECPQAGISRLRANQVPAAEDSEALGMSSCEGRTAETL